MEGVDFKPPRGLPGRRPVTAWSMDKVSFQTGMVSLCGGMQMTNELLGCRAPGELFRVGAGSAAIDVERGQAGLAQIVVHDAGGRVTKYVDGPGDRIGGDGQAAGHGFQQHQAEGVGFAGEYEDVGGVHLGQFGLLHHAKVIRVGIAGAQAGQRRAVAHHPLGAGQIQLQEGLDILFDRQRPT